MILELFYMISPSFSRCCGAATGIRTRDLILTMDALYQLSYRGVLDDFTIIVVSLQSVIVMVCLLLVLILYLPTTKRK